MVHLRPHHLLCLLTYVGKGYTPAFVANYDRIVRRLAEGEYVLIVDGPDEVCAALLHEPNPHCLRDSVRVRDTQAAADLADILNTPISIGRSMRLEPALLASMRKAFAAGLVRKACHGCEWFTLCSAIASNHYGGVRLQHMEY
jgi:uncharacterized protein